MCRFEGTDLGALCQVLFVPGITYPDYCLTTSPSLPESPFSSPSVGSLLDLSCGPGRCLECVPCACWGSLARCFEMWFRGSTPSRPGQRGLACGSLARAWEPAPRAKPQRSWPSTSRGRPGAVVGTVNDRLPPGEPQRRDVVRSRISPLGSGTQRSLWTPALPVPSSVPFQFCYPSCRLLASFVLSSGGSEVSPGGHWGAGSRAFAYLPPLWQLFWPTRPAQLGWRAHLLPCLAGQMETQRWPKADGEDGKSDSRAPGWGRRTQRKNLLCTWQLLSLLWLPCFLEINSNCCFPEKSFIFLPPLPSTPPPL